MKFPRFLLVLISQENLLRAALVTRDLKIASAAQQVFQVNDGVFDPAEVWYKMKKVIAACFDIGRTQPRELSACVLVSDERAWCVWQDNAGDVNSTGSFAHVTDTNTRFQFDVPRYGGTLRAWLLWNLSGAYVIPEYEMAMWRARAAQGEADLTEPRLCGDVQENCFGVIRARSPFAEPLPIAAMFSETMFAQSGQGDASRDDLVVRAAARVYEKISPETK